MTTFVFITQVVDPDHPALGATVGKIHALADRVDEVVVLALDGDSSSLPPNCRVVRFGGATKPARVARFASSLTIACHPRPVAVLAHMAPVYSVLAAPWCRPRRIPLLLWYTHWRATTMLRAAERVADRILSVDHRSFPLPSQKVVAIGHGIDVDEFPCIDGPRDRGPLRLLSLGRYSQAKGIETVIRAVAMVPGVMLTHHGPALTPGEEAHRVHLAAVVDELDIGARVVLGEPLPRSEVVKELARVDALVNNMKAGAPDKVVYEAGAACLPVLASNPVFDGFLPPSLRFERDDVAGLARRLAAFDRSTRSRTGHELRARVVDGHSSTHWADSVLDVARSVGR